MVGQGRVELPTSRLSGVRSNHLSYWPSVASATGWLVPEGTPWRFRAREPRSLDTESYAFYRGAR